MATHVSCTISAPVLKAVWAHIVKSKPVVFIMHVAVRGQLQALVTVPFTLNIITPKNKMTGFCLFVCTGVLKDWTQDFIHAIQAFYQTFHYARDLCVLKVETILKSCSEKLCFFACSVFCYRILDFSLAAVTNTDTHLPCSHSSAGEGHLLVHSQCLHCVPVRQELLGVSLVSALTALRLCLSRGHLPRTLGLPDFITVG